MEVSIKIWSLQKTVQIIRGHIIQSSSPVFSKHIPSVLGTCIIGSKFVLHGEGALLKRFLVLLRQQPTICTLVTITYFQIGHLLLNTNIH